MRVWFIGVTATIALLAACGQQTTTRQSTASASQSSQTADARFLAAAAMYENYQIQAAEVAASQGQSQAVKTYAAHSAATHRAALQALMQTAQSSGMPAPSGALNADYRAYIDRLRNDDPTPFDTRYVSQQALVTMSTAGRYDAFTTTAPNSALKHWASAQSQTVHDQITSAHRLAADVRAH